jgi:pimeloyl-ACP methyl ester carboxylesterase
LVGRRVERETLNRLLDDVRAGQSGVLRLPHSQLDMIDVGHFTWEDGADEYADIVTSWWAAW